VCVDGFAIARCAASTRWEGRYVRITDCERDHVDPGGALLGDLALELGEQVWRNALEALTVSHLAPC
jgi:hypothetical protein